MVSSLMNQSSPAECGNNTLVTVIVPVFNTRTDLVERAVLSALGQTHSDLELLIVDDGSNADVASFLDRLGQRDVRIRVIHQPNGGVSAARNTGLQSSMGDFIAYLDADDYLEPEFLSAALAVARGAQADAVFGGIRVLHGEGMVQWRTGGPSAKEPLLGTRNAIVSACIGALSDSPSPSKPTPLLSLTNVVSAIYRAGPARRHRFPEGVSHAEDRLHNVRFLLDADRVAFCSDVWYVYDASHEQGVTRRATPATITALSRTVREFAGVGVVIGNEQLSSSAQHEITQAASNGVLGYLKVLSGVMAAVGNPKTNRVQLRQLLTDPSVFAAISRSTQTGWQNMIFGVAARHRQSELMLILGWLWVKMGRLKMSVEEPIRRTGEKKCKNG